MRTIGRVGSPVATLTLRKTIEWVFFLLILNWIELKSITYITLEPKIYFEINTQKMSYKKNNVRITAAILKLGILRNIMALMPRQTARPTFDGWSKSEPNRTANIIEVIITISQEEIRPHKPNYDNNYRQRNPSDNRWGKGFAPSAFLEGPTTNSLFSSTS